MGTQIRIKFNIETVEFKKEIVNYQRMVCYSIGVVAYRLVQLNKDETEDRKNLNRLDILQGGIETRFIPFLSKETKQQI